MAQRPQRPPPRWRPIPLADAPWSGPTIAFFTGGDRFEDWFDKVGISLETFRQELTGGWLFNYVEALRVSGVRTVMFFASARVRAPTRFVHLPTGTPVCLLPSPWAHRKVRATLERFLPESKALSAMASYLATPIGSFARELRRAGCDAIVCQEYESARFDLCVWLGHRLGMPVFATYQGADQTLSWIERPFRRHSVRHCDGLIVAAGTEFRRVQATYQIDPRMIARIPNPMDVATWRPLDRSQARAAVGIPQDARIVAWHGHAQVWRKGLDVLLDAWDLVRASRPGANLMLLLVGTGRNIEALRRRAQADPTILWVDRYILDRDELWRYLSAANVYCLPSRHEGFAVAPVEAMACGLPVVATDASGVQDLLAGGEEGGGLIVPREDPAALAAGLLRLLDDDALAKDWGSRARRRAEHEFSLEVVGTRLRRFMFGGAPEGAG